MKKLTVSFPRTKLSEDETNIALALWDAQKKWEKIKIFGRAKEYHDTYVRFFGSCPAGCNVGCKYAEKVIPRDMARIETPPANDFMRLSAENECHRFALVRSDESGLMD